MRVKRTTRSIVAAVACVGLGAGLAACGSDDGNDNDNSSEESGDSKDDESGDAGDDAGDSGSDESPDGEDSDDTGSGAAVGGDCELLDADAVEDATGESQDVVTSAGACTFSPSGITVVSTEIGVDPGTYVDGLLALCESSTDVDVDGADEAFTCEAYEPQGYIAAGSTLYAITVSDVLAEGDVDTAEALGTIEELLPEVNID